jgi:hypothetical protein
LASDVRVAPEQPDASTVIDGKRKTVTARCSGTHQGSTDLERDLNPEEARDRRPGAEVDDRRRPSTSTSFHPFQQS